MTKVAETEKGFNASGWVNQTTAGKGETKAGAGGMDRPRRYPALSELRQSEKPFTIAAALQIARRE